MYFADFSNRLSAFISLTYKGKQILHISYLLVICEANIFSLCACLFHYLYVLVLASHSLCIHCFIYLFIHLF